MHRAIKQAEREVADKKERALLYLRVHGPRSKQYQKARAKRDEAEARLYLLKCDLVGWDNVVGAS